MAQWTICGFSAKSVDKQYEPRGQAWLGKYDEAFSGGFLPAFLVSIKEAEVKSQWTRPPMGLNMDKAKRRYTKMNPVNMKRVTAVTWKLLCRSEEQGHAEDTKQ